MEIEILVFGMSEINCPYCGEKIVLDGRFCKFCGGDLEEEILKLKQKKLPIDFGINGKGKDEADTKEKRKNQIIITIFILSGIILLVTLSLSSEFYFEIWYYVLIGISLPIFVITGIYVQKLRRRRQIKEVFAIK